MSNELKPFKHPDYVKDEDLVEIIKIATGVNKNLNDDTIIATKKQEFAIKDSGARESFSTGSKRDIRIGKGRFDLLPWIALKRWAIHMEKGAVKYGERNWELGQPLDRYYDSAVRHLMNWFEGQTDEDHLAAALFNVGAILFTEDAIMKGTLPKELDSLAAKRNV